MPSPAQFAANRLNIVNNESARQAASAHAASAHSASEPHPQNAETPGSTSGRTPEGRTAEGKARSSLNALRHGLTARVVVLPSEDMAAYREFSKELVASLDAQTPLERQFAQTIADNQWRINRIRSIEDGMLALGHSEVAQATVRCATGSQNDAGDFDADHPQIHAALTAARAFRDDSKSFVNLSIYEQRLHRSLKEALRQLKELQAERRERYKTEMDDAIRLLKTHEMKGLPDDRAANDFVYASAQIASESDRRDRLQDSVLAEKAGFNFTRYTAWTVPPEDLYENEAA